jgi:drug/metabolite transporter (DMT)-like permease
VVVVFVWATSWILIKGKLHDIAALSFAGLRYGLAFVCLLALLLGRPALRSSVVALPRRSWLRLGTLGLLLYGLTQATVFLGLYRLPAVTVSLLLSLTPALVTVLAIPLLGEVPTPVQGGGVLLSLAGTLVYFGPVALPALTVTVVSGPTRGPCSGLSWWPAVSSWSNAVGSATVRPLHRRQ